jgi:hypothetical protein
VDISVETLARIFRELPKRHSSQERDGQSSASGARANRVRYGVQFVGGRGYDGARHLSFATLEGEITSASGTSGEVCGQQA